MKVAKQAKKLLLETLNHHTAKEDNSLRKEESEWLEDYIGKGKQQAPVRPIHKERWQIRETKDNFQTWRKSQDICTIFFDGASKGNPGRSGAGGVIYYRNGEKEEFSWGLGVKTNNQAEILSLWKACQIASKESPKEILIIGDSELLIKTLVKKENLKDPALNKQLSRVNRILKDLFSVQIYHILRGLNKDADRLANIGCSLQEGMISINAGDPTKANIP